MKTLYKALITLLALSFGGAASAKESPKSLPDFDTKLAHELVEKEQAILLDVRTQSEYDREHLPNSHRIELQQLGKKLDEVKKLTKGNMDHPIVVFCQSGGRSSSAKNILKKAGYTRVTNLGGYKNWYKTN